MTKEEIFSSVCEYFNGDELAANVWIDKYALKDKNGDIKEKTPEDMHRRLAKEFSRIESNYPNPISEKKIFELFDRFRYIVPQGSPMFGIGNEFSITSLSNCFVIDSAIDSYGGIMRTDEEQIQLMKRRGGVGHDLSNLRPAGALANNAALNDMAGSVLYAQRFSNSTKEVRQGDRRGALMLSISIKHPDAERFIDSKLESGKITDANISVRITDEFMGRVVCDGDFYQTFPIDLEIPYCSKDYDLINKLEYNKLLKVDGGYIKKVKARYLWDKIIKNAWKSAEPGILFWDTIIRESPADCYGEEWKTKSTNPCLTGDTIIAVADGRNGVTIKELADKGSKFLVYCADKNASNGNRGGGWKVNIKEGIAFKTGIRKVLEVILSDGSSFRCTPDHLLATFDGNYVEAKDSLGVKLGKFYSFSNKNNGSSYRHINSRYNGYSKQYRMIYEYFYGSYDGKLYNIDHIDRDSTNDSLNNLRLLDINEHVKITDRIGESNPIHKIVGTERLRLMNKRKNIYANAKKYNWDNDRLENSLMLFDKEFGNLLKELEPEDINVNLDESIYVDNIIELAKEEVYDIYVEDYHNFYIITKTDDDKFLNSSGLLVHNCGEIPLCPQDSCRLMSINLYSYVVNPFEKDAYFNFDLFKEHVIIAQRLMDDLVDLELEKINRILEKIENDPESDSIKSVEKELWENIFYKTQAGRRTGLGTTGEGDMLAALGFTYGSGLAIDMSERVHEQLAISSYVSSIIMAKERESFLKWDFELEKNNPFVSRVINWISDFNYSDSELGRFDLVYKQYGRRNISNLTIAPTGTTSIMTQTTSGIEPCFAVFYKRRRRTIDKSKATFIDEHGEMFEEYNVFHHKFKDWYDKNWYKTDIKLFDIDYKKPLEDYTDEELNILVSKSPYHNSTSSDVNWVDKVKLQGRVQKWVDHSISATTNIPENTPISVVDDIYMTAYKSGCKGMTIYREGSRSGILVNDKKNNFEYVDAVKRPKELECDIYHKVALKINWMILVGKYEGKPYEIFAFPELPNHIFPYKIQKGTIRKLKSRVYKLVGVDKEFDKSYEIPNIIDLIENEDQVGTRKYSMMLRHKIDPKFIVSEIEQYALVTSFDKVVQRVLRNYIDGEFIECPECGSKLQPSDGCWKCLNCGYSKCG